LLDSDSSDSKDALDLNDDLEANFHHQGSGREILIGDASRFERMRSGRRVIAPNAFEMNYNSPRYWLSWRKDVCVPLW
jgi:hypothetical protein